MSAGATLSSEELAAARVVALGFRGGAPLRAVLDSTEAAYGAAAWARPVAQRHLLSETVQWAPPPRRDAAQFTFGARRCARFVRLLLDEVERARCEPTQALVELAARAVAGGSRPQPGETPHLAVRAPDGRDIVLRAGNNALTNDTGLRLWEAGAFLFLALRAPPLAADIAGRSILELGSGLGLTARALADAGAARAVLTDGAPAVLDALRSNVRRVAEESPPPPTELRVARLNVCDASAVARLSAAHAVDTVLAADITYDPALAAGVARAIECAVCGADSEDRKVVAYIFATRRSEATDRALRDALASTALNVEELPLAVDKSALAASSIGVLLACNRSWDFCKVRVFRLT